MIRIGRAKNFIVEIIAQASHRIIEISQQLPCILDCIN